MDVGVWLRGLGLGRYEAAFRENEIDSKVLPKLTAEDLKGLCHVAVPRARSVGTSGIVRPLRLQSATWSSRHREARGAFGRR